MNPIMGFGGNGVYGANPYAAYGQQGEYHRNMQYVPPQKSDSAATGEDQAVVRPAPRPAGGKGGKSKGSNYMRVGYEENQVRQVVDVAPDAVSRTVHIVGLDGMVPESVFAAELSDCGVVVNAKICGDSRGRTLYGFIEFSTREGAEKFVAKSGAKIGSTNLTVSFARSAIRTEMADKKIVFDMSKSTPMVESAAYCPETVPTVGGKKGLPGSAYGKGARGYSPYAGAYQVGGWAQPQPVQGVQSLLQAAQVARLAQTLQAAQAAQTARTWATSPAVQLEYYNQQVKQAYQNAGITYGGKRERDDSSSASSERRHRKKHKKEKKDKKDKKKKKRHRSSSSGR